MDLFPDLIFVVKNQLLGIDAINIMLLLLQDFHKILKAGVRNNFELRQFYKPVIENVLTVNDFSEIVLRYSDDTVYFSDPVKYPSYLECRVHCGLIEFLIKVHNGDFCEYSKINLVKLSRMTPQDLSQQRAKLYRDVNATHDAEISARMVRNQYQTQRVAKINHLATNLVEKIIQKNKMPLVASNIYAMKSNVLINSFPDLEIIDIANVVASYATASGVCQRNKIVLMIVPATEVIPFAHDHVDIVSRINRYRSEEAHNEKYVDTYPNSNVDILKLCTSDMECRAAVKIDLELAIVDAEVSTMRDSGFYVKKIAENLAVLTHHPAAERRVTLPSDIPFSCEAQRPENQTEISQNLAEKIEKKLSNHTSQ